MNPDFGVWKVEHVDVFFEKWCSRKTPDSFKNVGSIKGQDRLNRSLGVLNLKQTYFGVMTY